MKRLKKNTMNLLKNIFSYDELKEILFSIDEFEVPNPKKFKKSKKKIKMKLKY